MKPSQKEKPYIDNMDLGHLIHPKPYKMREPLIDYAYTEALILVSLCMCDLSPEEHSVLLRMDERIDDWG